MRGTLGLIALAVATTGCATVTVPPGPGDVSDAAKERLAAQERAANADAALRAWRIALERSDGRLLRKAMVVTANAVETGALSPDGARAAATPLLARISRDCGARADGAKLLESVADFGGAGDLLLGSVEKCTGLERVEAAVHAVSALRRVSRCVDAIGAVRAVWPEAPKEQWTPLLDAVRECSDDLTLRSNLSFLPDQVLRDYLALLQARASEAQRSSEPEPEESQQAPMVTPSGPTPGQQCLDQCDAAERLCDAGCPILSPARPECLQSCTTYDSNCRANCP